MKYLFDNVSEACSKITTNIYSTSFSSGIKFLNKRLRSPIYAIYGFVRLADEIVDSFHGFNKKELLEDFKKDTYKAINDGISLNPILNAFQKAVNAYAIQKQWIDIFFSSMEMDLEQTPYDIEKFNRYILGSAEAVGLMCLHIFTENDIDLYNKLTPSAMKLGAAFQKVNFLRDLKADYQVLGRTYFPDINMDKFSCVEKRLIEQQIELDFNEAIIGIKQLPKSSRAGVYLAYAYYKSLFNKIKNLPAEKVLQARVRIPNLKKILLMLNSIVRFRMDIVQ